MYRHGARRNMVEDLALAAQGKQGVNIEAPDRRKLVADCSDLAATDRVMERRVAARKRVLKARHDRFGHSVVREQLLSHLQRRLSFALARRSIGVGIGGWAT
jgi:hypothetical protein